MRETPGTPKGRQEMQAVEYIGTDLRRYPVEEERDAHGNLIRFRRVEELVEGRWEGYVSIVEEIKKEDL
jgi:hypothetical protein